MDDDFSIFVRMNDTTFHIFGAFVNLTLVLTLANDPFKVIPLC